MLFTQIEFVCFIAVVFGYLLLVKNFRWQKIFLLVASYYFYGYWNYSFLLLILLCTVVNYFAAIGIAASGVPRIKKSLLLFSLIFCLGILGYYKYCNFFIESFNVAFKNFGLNLGSMDILLPVGISFFTFQTLSYTIDVYRGQLKVCRNFFDFALFVAFFPQLVAGPIVRASEFLPQLETPREMSYERFFLGTRQFMFGLFKKVFIADNLAVFVDACFESHQLFSGVTLWLAALAYALQIYCDFCGYSDMAIGLAKIMGYDFNVNFNLPYISRSVSEFWHRWHISLSTWLRDYLYIPLGGNRKGIRRTYINLFLTMLLGGLWHGAAWTFVFWGGWHGLALGIHKFFKNRRKEEKSLPSLISWFLTMTVVLTGWIFFRSTSFKQAYEILLSMVTFKSGIGWYEPVVVVILVLAVVYHLMCYFRKTRLWELRQDSFYGTTVIFLLLLTSILFRPSGFQPFIYFQF